MESVKIEGTDPAPSRSRRGAGAIGGWMSGGTGASA